jgi:chaperonin GroEL
MAATTMAMAGSAATAPLRAESKAASSLSSSAAMGRVGFGGAGRQAGQRRVQRMAVKAAKELHFNKDGSAIKRMQVRRGGRVLVF